MSDDLSPLLGLPLLQPAQAQKHVTHNEALLRLEVLVQAAVDSRSADLPPDDPPEGARYLIPAGAGGSWAGRDGQIAAFLQGAWDYLSPQPGWQVWIRDEGQAARQIGGSWISEGAQSVQFDRLGLGATAPGGNRLAVGAAASLFTHEGAGHQIKVNKAAEPDTASLLFQTGWSGRAEMGTTGSDQFAIKTSADGSAWVTALAFDPATGAPSGAALTSGGRDTTPGRLVKSGDYGWPVALELGAAQDLDLLTGSSVGICASAGDTPGNHYPEASAGAFLQIDRPGAGAAVQVYLCEATAALWTRAQNSAGLWQPWQRQSSQSGSGADGQWLRLPDGTQICHHLLSISASAATSWSYPQGFSAAPVVTGTAQTTGFAALCLDAAPTGSAATLSLRGADGARVAGMLHLTAIGRWA